MTPTPSAHPSAACTCEHCLGARQSAKGTYESDDGAAYTLLQIIARALFCWTPDDMNQRWFDVAQERDNERLFRCSCAACQTEY